MRIGSLSKLRAPWVAVPLLLVLAACGSGAPQPKPSHSAAAEDNLPVMGPERRILAFGDSLFAGYNVKESEAYPARLETALRAQGVNARISNGAVSGDTSAAALQRLAFTLGGQASPPDLAIVELGGNDMLRGLSPKETKANIGASVKELQARKIPVLIMGMRAPPNLVAAYRQEFDAVYPALAKQYGVPLVPFFLQSIYDKPDLLQQDRMHPTPRGIEELVAATIDDVKRALPEKK